MQKKNNFQKQKANNIIAIKKNHSNSKSASAENSSQKYEMAKIAGLTSKWELPRPRAVSMYICLPKMLTWTLMYKLSTVIAQSDITIFVKPGKTHSNHDDLSLFYTVKNQKINKHQS